MLRIVSASLSIVILLAVVIATEHQAWGYVDPGSGLLALLRIASVVAAFAYFLRRRIRLLFSRRRGDTPSPSANRTAPAKPACKTA